MYSGVILVLKGVSVEVPTGKIIALLGANGAGKTTTLKAISGLLHTEDGAITGGSVSFNGSRIDHLSPPEIVQLGLVQVMEGRRVLQHLTVEQNLVVASHLRKDPIGVKNDLQTVYDYFPALKELRRQTAGYLSGGEQQMLVIGRAIMAKPKIIMLDEPSLGLAPMFVREIFSIIKQLNEQQNLGFLLVEQNVKAALSLAHYGYVLENGRIVLQGTNDELIGNEDIKEFYLGLSLQGGRKSYREVKHYKRRKRWLG